MTLVEKSFMKISVFGLGYVGAVSLACLARDGHKVIGVDLDLHKTELIRQGRSPIVEPGLNELMAAVVAQGQVTLTDAADYAINNSELSFVCVGTPCKSNGSQDLTSIKRLAQQLGGVLAQKSGYHLVVIRSTVLPGTVEEVIKPMIERTASKRAGVDFGLCFQPEFLREGSSIRDYDNPPFTLVGANSSQDVEPLRAIFEHLPCRFVDTTIRTAEMLKYACNAFHALKITFANEIGRLSQALGVDADAVMRLVCQDTNLNISPAYLRPGFAFGGSCLPKDLRALMYAAKTDDVAVPMLSAILASNQLHVERALELILESGKKSVGMIGLSFKSGTDDLRESPLVALAERLIGKGLQLKVFDPEVHMSRLIGANRRYIEETIPHVASLMCPHLEEVVEGSDALVVGIKPDDLPGQLQAIVRKDQFLLDLVNLPAKEALRCRYQGICW
jgi:GDP-mannose 6-dehydrogenase